MQLTWKPDKKEKKEKKKSIQAIYTKMFSWSLKPI